MANGDTDRDMRRILMAVGFVLGLLWFGIMFGILSFLHFREKRVAKEKIEKERDRVAKISSALIHPPSTGPGASRPRVTLSKPDETDSAKRTNPKVFKKGDSSTTLQVPPATQMQRRRSTLPVGASHWSFTREQMATLDVTVTGWQALLQNRTKAPSTQDRSSTAIVETALSR